MHQTADSRAAHTSNSCSTMLAITARCRRARLRRSRQQTTLVSIQAFSAMIMTRRLATAAVWRAIRRCEGCGAGGANAPAAEKTSRIYSHFVVQRNGNSRTRKELPARDAESTLWSSGGRRDEPPAEERCTVRISEAALPEHCHEPGRRAGHARGGNTFRARCGAAFRGHSSSGCVPPSHRQDPAGVRLRTVDGRTVGRAVGAGADCFV